jgi:hypothetical protein
VASSIEDGITQMLRDELLSPSETIRLRQSFAAVRNDDWSEREERQLLHWARRVRLQAAMLKLALSGLADLDIDQAGDGVLVRREG